MLCRKLYLAGAESALHLADPASCDCPGSAPSPKPGLTFNRYNRKIMKLVRITTTSFLVFVLAACASVQAGTQVTDQAAVPAAAEVASVQPVVPTETSTAQLVETVGTEAPPITPQTAVDTPRDHPTSPPSPTATPEPAAT